MTDLKSKLLGYKERRSELEQERLQLVEEKKGLKERIQDIQKVEEEVWSAESECRKQVIEVADQILEDNFSLLGGFKLFYGGSHKYYYDSNRKVGVMRSIDYLFSDWELRNDIFLWDGTEEDPFKDFVGDIGELHSLRKKSRIALCTIVGAVAYPYFRKQYNQLANQVSEKRKENKRTHWHDTALIYLLNNYRAK